MILRAPAPAGYDDLVAERCRRVPLQHLTGTASFAGLSLAVGPGVFVPRPETEVVLALAVQACRGRVEPVVVDLCTGSGAIALAVAQAVPEARVHAVERSPLAHAWAQRNVRDSELDVELALGDALTAYPDLRGVVDVVVTNPPYIPDDMVPIDPEVSQHDPAEALYGGPGDGLQIPLAIAGRAAILLREGGALVMEHAETQSASVVAALRADGRWAEVVDHPDLTGRPRAVVAVRGHFSTSLPGRQRM